MCLSISETQMSPGYMSGHEPESLSPYDQQVYHLEKQLDIECKVKQGADQVWKKCFIDKINSTSLQYVWKQCWILGFEFTSKRNEIIVFITSSPSPTCPVNFLTFSTDLLSELRQIFNVRFVFLRS